MFCKCNQPRKCYPLKDWRVIRYQYTPHGYSRVKCLKCGCVWITRAKYVEQTPNEDGQKRLFSMELNDKSPMPQGKFKGQPMENVPYWYLLWLDGKPFCNRNVQKYIDENRDVLELEKKWDKYRNESENSN